MQPVQYRPRPDATGRRARPQLGRLQPKCSMWPLVVVGPDELGEYRPEVLLIEDDQVVEALSAKCPDDSFNDRVRTRAHYGRGDGVDADALGPCTDVAAIHGIAITQQMPRLASPGRRLDELPPDPGRGRVRGDGDMHQFAPAVGDEDQHVQRLERERRDSEQIGRPEVVRMVV